MMFKVAPRFSHPALWYQNKIFKSTHFMSMHFTSTSRFLQFWWPPRQRTWTRGRITGWVISQIEHMIVYFCTMSLLFYIFKYIILYCFYCANFLWNKRTIIPILTTLAAANLHKS